MNLHFPLLDELPDGHLEPNYQETIADAYFNAEQDAEMVKNGTGPQSGGSKKKKTLKHKKNKGKTLKKTLKRKKGGSKRKLKRKGKK